MGMIILCIMCTKPCALYMAEYGKSDQVTPLPRPIRGFSSQKSPNLYHGLGDPTGSRPCSPSPTTLILTQFQLCWSP